MGSGYNLGSARCQHGSGGPGLLLGQELGTTQAVAILNFDIDIQRRLSDSLTKIVLLCQRGSLKTSCQLENSSAVRSTSHSWYQQSTTELS